MSQFKIHITNRGFTTVRVDTALIAYRQFPNNTMHRAILDSFLEYWGAKKAEVQYKAFDNGESEYTVTFLG